MPEHALHPDLAAHALAGLAPAEARAVEAHIADCADCRRALERFRGTAALLERAVAPFEVPAGLESATLAALAGAGLRPPAQRGERRRRALVAAAVAAALAVGAIVGIGVVERGDAPAGRLELSATLSAAADPTMSASVTVRATPLGRDVQLGSESLPILPTGSFYELWFVGAHDSPGRLDRISAGTFHPDAQGRTRLHLHAAVDPALFPTLAVTSEVGDGDPRPGREVLRYSR